MAGKLAAFLGISLTTFTGRYNVHRQIEEFRSLQAVTGIQKLLLLCEPGTDIDVRIAVSDGRSVSIGYKLAAGECSHERISRRKATGSASGR